MEVTLIPEHPRLSGSGTNPQSLICRTRLFLNNCTALLSKALIQQKFIHEAAFTSICTFRLDQRLDCVEEKEWMLHMMH